VNVLTTPMPHGGELMRLLFYFWGKNCCYP